MALALELMRGKKVDVTSWTNVTPLDEAENLFRQMLHPGDRDLKAVFVP